MRTVCGMATALDFGVVGRNRVAVEGDCGWGQSARSGGAFQNHSGGMGIFTLLRVIDPRSGPGGAGVLGEFWPECFFLSFSDHY